MYVEEIVTKRKGKEYRTLLVRESFRVGSTVSHRTLANISHLPRGCVEEIKRYLQGKTADLDFSQVQVVDSKEYGASQSVLSIARKLELDTAINFRRVQWREDVLAMIAGRLLYQGNELSLTNMFADTVLWESCGHSPNTQPDISEHCYYPLERLLAKQESIQKKLADKHLEKGAIALFYLASTIVREQVESFELSDKDRKHRYKEINTGLLTNSLGCPIAIEILPSPGFKRVELQGQIKKIADKFGLQSVVFVGDREILNENCIAEINVQGFRTITALKQNQIHALIERKVVFLNLFSVNQLHEVNDPDNSSWRYILCLNQERKEEQLLIRNEFIKKTEELLIKIQRSKEKEIQVITAAVGKIWTNYKTEKFFDWHVQDGKLHFSVNTFQVQQEQQLDGCFIIFTDVEKKIMSALETVNSYQKLLQVKQSLRIIKTISVELCPISLDTRVQAHVLLSMLSYYLEWHMNKKLAGIFKREGKNKVRSWTFTEAIERLKSIRSQTIRIGNITLDQVKTTLDEEQREIVSALGVALVAKLHA